MWFIIYNLLKNVTSMKNQTKNLTTFLTGTVLYVLFYYYAESFDLLKRIFHFFIYIIIFDGFAMSIIYKNLEEGHKINVEPIKKAVSSSGHKRNVEPIKKAETITYQKETSENILLLNNESNYIEENEGFTKDSALGNAYNTNGNSNA